MKIILSPAKKMRVCEDHNFDMTVPEFDAEHDLILEDLAKKDFESLKSIYACSDALAKEAQNTLLAYVKDRNMPKSPALLSYNGIAFQSLAPAALTDGQWEYLQKHLYILSAVFGALRPLDAIHPYRLEMQAKYGFDLYAFWSEKLSPLFENEAVVNLASKEYSKVLKDHPDRTDIFFYEEENGKRKEMAVYAKAARGAMVSWMALHNVQSPEELKNFDELGYRFDTEASSERKLVFTRPKPAKKKRV